MELTEHLSAELEDDRRQLREVSERAEALIEGLNADSARWRPEPNRWCVSECLDHLNATSRPYLSDLAATVERAKARGTFGDRPPKRGWLGSWFINVLEPPPKRTFKAPSLFVPARAPEISAVVEEFRGHKKRWDELLVESNGLDLWKVKMRMSAFKLIKMSIGEIYAFLLAHERRHLWQAEQVIAHPQFPRTTSSLDQTQGAAS